MDTNCNITGLGRRKSPESMELENLDLREAIGNLLRDVNRLSVAAALGWLVAAGMFGAALLGWLR
jgi:hypothetical protein